VKRAPSIVQRVPEEPAAEPETTEKLPPQPTEATTTTATPATIETPVAAAPATPKNITKPDSVEGQIELVKQLFTDTSFVGFV
jgi:hypothetical protein